MEKDIYYNEEEIDDKTKIRIGIFNLIGIMAFTIVGLILKHLFFY